MENRSRLQRISKKVKGGLVSPKSPNCIVMPNKDEGDDKKSTKDVVNKKQKQMMNQEDYLPEEGYDVARDEGKVKSSEDKKDATTMPVSDEVKKTQKKNKGPSALERVKADIEKKYGKGAIMKTKKEELDLTKVAEAFGGYIVEAPIDAEGNITAKKGDAKKTKKKISKIQKEITGKNIDVDAERKILDAKTNKKAMKDAGTDQLLDKVNQKSKPRKIRKRLPSKSTLDKIKQIDIKEPTYKSPVTGKKMPIRLGKNLKNIGVKSTKSVQTALKQGAKTTAKTALKRGAVTGTGKLIAKRVPGIGAAISGAETFGRAASGDYVGAAISGAETIANLIPGVQQTLGTGLAGLGMVRDIRKASKAVNTAKKTIQTAKAARGRKGFSAFMKPARQIKKKYATMPDNVTKLGQKVRGKTKLGRGLRAIGVGQEFLPGGGVGRRIVKGLVGGAKKSVDGGHVGRRTAG